MPDRIHSLQLDYPLNPYPRYEQGKHPHQGLLDLIGNGRQHYRSILDSCSAFSKDLARIPCLPPTVQLSTEDWESLPGRYELAVAGDETTLQWFAPLGAEVARDFKPCWLNGFIPGLDALALYVLTATRRPKVYLEIGSGNSTKFVRQAIVDQRLSTRITSIDPRPRAAIDQICDELIRLPLEECELSVFGALAEGDMVFMDGSHRCFMNSDATVFFLDVLPELAAGVLVGIHDIFLPYDYPARWARRGYSEQYLLAAALLAGSTRFRVELPCYFASVARDLRDLLEQIWIDIPNVVARHGSSFWIVTL